jgi:molybdopterin synthase catalytic subunit
MSASPATTLRIRVRLFAVQREIAGTRQVDLELPRPATVEDAWTALVARIPALGPGRASVRFAVNGDYADATTTLNDRDELACIPPVSGGDGTAATDQRRIIEIREDAFGPDILTGLTARLATDEDGAVVGFLGRTRSTPGTAAPGQEAEAQRHEGRAVESLEYEAHEQMALRILDRIADEIAERFDVHRVAIVHRVGEVPLGDVSIAVLAVSPHRDAAFQAARYAIDETKHRVPIWKAERFADGHVWIGEPARTQPPTGDAAQTADAAGTRDPA